MKSNYKKLGPYINLVSERNKELQEVPLMGLSISKKFIPSIANLIGTDMSTYRTINRNQFAYSPVTSRNGDKITIALFQDFDKGLISQAYTPFEVTDTNELLPEYLMMWFRRTEFDRYARFMSHGSARELFSWEDFCEMELPIPHISKQIEIVKEYKVIQNRIAHNQQLIQKLEETAQAIYKQWFVDFEFPDEEGKPYKSSGGEMVESELGEIPRGWRVVSIKDFGLVITGKTPSSDNPEDFGNQMPFVTPGDFKNYGKFVLSAERKLSEDGFTKLKNKILKPNSVIVTCIGSDMGKVVITKEECITNQQMNSIEVNQEYYSDYLFYYLKSIYKELKSIAMGGSTMPMLSKSQFEIISLVKPNDLILQDFFKVMKPLNGMNYTNSKISKSAIEMKNLLLSKLATIEN